MLRRRFARWHAGDIIGLWSDVNEAWAREIRTRDVKRQQTRDAPNDKNNQKQKESLFRRVKQLTHARQLSKACKLLLSRGLVPMDDANFAKVQALFPSSNDAISQVPTAGDLELTEDELARIILSSPGGASPGPSGLRIEHLQQAICAQDIGADILNKLVAVIASAINGLLPPEVRVVFCSARLAPIRKKDGGIRPILLCEVIRTLAGKALLKCCAPQIRALDLGAQLGMDSSGSAAQAAIMAAHSWTNNLEGNLIVKLDLKNAFNCVSRAKCLHACEELLPDVAPYAAWILNGATEIYVDGRTITASQGVFQGDPISPLLFDMGVQAAIETANDLEIKQVWWHDDALLYGTPKETEAAVKRIQACLTSRGLALNKTKCEIYSLTQVRLEGELGQMTQINDPRKWTYLGCPLNVGPNNLFDKILENTTKIVDSISEFSNEAPLEALSMLVQCTGACRFEYLSKGLPTGGTELEALLRSGSASLRRGMEAILASQMPDSAWRQACLPRRMGGLGIRCPHETSTIARYAAVTSAGTLATQLGGAPAHISRQQLEATSAVLRLIGKLPDSRSTVSRKTQHEIAVIYYSQQQTVLQRSLSPFHQARLSSLSTPHATAWLEAFNSAQPPDAVRLVLRWSLAIPLTAQPFICPSCTKEADPDGLHSVMCQRSGDIGRGHTALKNAFQRLLIQGGISVKREVSLPNFHSLRPADLLLEFVRDQPLAVDFTVVTPSIRQYSRRDGDSAGTTLDAAAQAKYKKYQLACKNNGWEFRPIVADTFGAFRSDARTFIRGIIKAACLQRPHENPATIASSIWQQVSTAAVSRTCSQLRRAAIVLATPAVQVPAATAGSATPTSAVLPDLNMGTSTLSLPSSAPAHSSSSLNPPTAAGAGADPQEDAAVEDVEMEHASQEPPPDPQQFLLSLRP